MADSAAVPEELLAAPLSQELLNYYRYRLVSYETEMTALRERVDEIDVSQATLHKSKWSLQKRTEDVAELHRALSDSHVFVWNEKEQCDRLQATNDELRIQLSEQRRKIAHLLSVVDSRAAQRGVGAEPAASEHGAERSGARRAGASHAPGTARSMDDGRFAAGGDTHSLMLTIESLRAQLQQQQRSAGERLGALLEDRRLRVSEEAARRAADAEQLRETELRLQQTDGLLSRYTLTLLTPYPPPTPHSTPLLPPPYPPSIPPLPPFYPPP